MPQMNIMKCLTNKNNKHDKIRYNNNSNKKY